MADPEIDDEYYVIFYVSALGDEEENWKRRLRWYDQTEEILKEKSRFIRLSNTYDPTK